MHIATDITEVGDNTSSQWKHHSCFSHF